MDRRDLTGSTLNLNYLTAAFGTFGHNILLLYRIHKFGLSGSYLIYTLVSIN